jgi:hypothetical protein
VIRNLTNISQAQLVLTDFNGLTIEAGETVDGLMFGEMALKNSLDVINAIVDGNLKVNDGTKDYTGQRAVDLVKGFSPDQLTRDGKRIVTTSDRPQDHYRYFTTCGDDWDLQTRGDGQCLQYTVLPSSDQTLEVRFIDDTYLKDGSMIYYDAEMGSWLRVDLFVPANMPFPAKNANGNFDYVDGAWVPNATNTGKYFILPQETLVHRFINKMAMFGMGRQRENIETTEPNFIPKGWIVRLSIHNASSTETIRATVTLGMYRKITF